MQLKVALFPCLPLVLHYKRRGQEEGLGARLGVNARPATRLFEKGVGNAFLVAVASAKCAV